MALDTRLPLGVQGIDTTQAVPAMQDAQNNALAQIQQKYKNASAEEQLDVLSTGLGAAQALQMAEADPAAAMQFLESRNQKIMARKGDNENTQLLLDTIKKDPAQFKQLAGAYVKTAQMAGAFELGTDSQGGSTGVLLNRLVQAGQQENPNYGLLDALEDLKGGAGQRGRNLADIQSGRQAGFEVQGGKTTGQQAAEAGNLGGPSKADIAGQVKGKETRASQTEQKLVELEDNLADLEGFTDLTTEAKAIVKDIPEWKLGPIQGRVSAAVRDPDVKNLIGVQNSMALQARTMMSLPASGFSDADREFLEQIAGGKFPSGKSFVQAVDRLDSLNEKSKARLRTRMKNFNAVNEPAPPLPGQTISLEEFLNEGN